MAEKILIMGESGTGKSTSMRNFTPDELAVVNPVGKPLPFKGKYEMLNGETDSRKIIKFMRNTNKKVIVVDDFQYLLSIPYMDRIKEAGWDKWNDFASNYFETIDICAELPEDVTVYFITHTETLDNGITTIKLIGKLLREKITIEGLFTTVLRTQVVDGKYYFLTQNSGKDTVKAPMGMFPSYAIDNDLKYVDEKIRNYYEVGDFKSDEEIRAADEAVAIPDIEKPSTGGRGRKTRTSTKAKTRDEVIKDNDEKLANSNINPDDPREEVPFEEAKEPELEKVPRRTRKDRSKSEDKVEPEQQGEMTGAMAAFDKAQTKYGIGRRRRTSQEEIPDDADTPPTEEPEEKPKRRTRRSRA